MGSPRPPLNPFLPSAKSDVLRREQKRTQNFKMEELPGPLITDQQNFSVETKQEPDYVSTATNIFCARGMFFSSSSVLWCFSPPAGDKMFWLAVLTVGKRAWQRAGTMAMWLTWVRRLFGHKASACRVYREPTNDGLAYVSACWKPSCYFNLLFGQRSEHTPGTGFDWLLWLVTGVLGLQDKPFGYSAELFEFALSHPLCIVPEF